MDSRSTRRFTGLRTAVATSEPVAGLHPPAAVIEERFEVAAGVAVVVTALGHRS